MIGLVSGTVSAAARSVGHGISFGITIVMMVAVDAFMYYSLKHRRTDKGWCFYYGPFIFTTFAATPLVLADLLRHVFQDGGIWQECERAANVIWNDDCLWSSSQYHCTLPPPHCIPDANENMTHLSFIGVLFTIVFTYMGFICLAIGTLWNADICSKCSDMKQQWRELRTETIN